MNWKTLGKAALVTCGLFGIIALILVLGHFCPWICMVVIFAGVYSVMSSCEEEEGEDD